MGEEDLGGWLEREVASCQFQDVRHGKRFRILLGQLSERIGGSIPLPARTGRARKQPIGFWPTSV